MRRGVRNVWLRPGTLRDSLIPTRRLLQLLRFPQVPVNIVSVYFRKSIAFCSKRATYPALGVNFVGNWVVCPVNQVLKLSLDTPLLFDTPNSVV